MSSQHSPEVSQAVIERTFAGISDADKRKIVHDNAARLYGFG